ncbi:hypothetical protein BDN71DRAFT_1510612 [Pleurotus eryngii]|uniref:Uncharacterized protein n=1 Tax=Pleurotus eryngii TaxID=5323 RepID=A0A9P5ZSR3_PLEER|nr:hypothetical protein BDN71DRAFT_1510612 [Pleurotus eryngii]
MCNANSCTHGQAGQRRASDGIQLIAYAHTTCTSAASPLSSSPRHSLDVLEAQRTIARLTPFDGRLGKAWAAMGVFLGDAGGLSLSCRSSHLLYLLKSASHHTTTTRTYTALILSDVFNLCSSRKSEHNDHILIMVAQLLVAHNELMKRPQARIGVFGGQVSDG